MFTLSALAANTTTVPVKKAVRDFQAVVILQAIFTAHLAQIA